MIDERILDLIVESANLKKGEKVLEIGPGEGALTMRLADKCSVTAIESDDMFIEELELEFPDVKIINANALKIAWPPFDKCVSNLPYAISKKFILRLIKYDFELAVIVLQKEFAEKLAALPGEKNYGVVSIAVQSCCDIELLEKIPRNAFKPQPKVESELVRLTKKKKVDLQFVDFVSKLFQKRNKKLGDKRVRDFSPSELLKAYYDGKSRS